MSAMQLLRSAGDRSPDPFVARLDDLLTELAAVVGDDSAVDDADRIDRLDRLERARSVIAAVQVAETVRFARSQAKEIAGELRERIAEQVVTEIRHLDAGQRRTVDAKVTAAKIDRMGVRSAAACARKHAYEADPQAYVERGRTERKHRRGVVAARAGHDGLVECLSAGRARRRLLGGAASAHGHAEGVGGERSRDQIMADTLVERLTGQAAADDVSVEVQLLMPWELLLDPKAKGSALIPGHGPVPGYAIKPAGILSAMR